MSSQRRGWDNLKTATFLVWLVAVMMWLGVLLGVIAR